jgi:hypothetical protein
MKRKDAREVRKEAEGRKGGKRERERGQLTLL